MEYDSTLRLLGRSITWLAFDETKPLASSRIILIEIDFWDLLLLLLILLDLVRIAA